jgi:hypothetical protein
LDRVEEHEMDRALFTAKARGRARQAAAALRGDVGLLGTLAGEHAEMDSLLSQAAIAPPPALRRLYPIIRGELCAHAKAEEFELYDVLIAYAATRSLAEEGRAEHEKLLTLIAKLDRIEVDHPAWREGFAALRRGFARHVETDEEQLFPLAREILGEHRLRDLDRVYQLRRDQLEREVAAWPPSACFEPRP